MPCLHGKNAKAMQATTMQPKNYEDVLHFWFPPHLGRAGTDLAVQVQRWFRGGSDADVAERFGPLLQRAARGEHDDWSFEPRSRLALIVVLDQFSRSLRRGTAQAFAQDAKAVSLAREGIAAGHYAALDTPWEKTFFMLPFGHSEKLSDVELAVELAQELVAQAPQEFRWWFEFSVGQARGNRDVIARFGRHPHRNEALGRLSAPEEIEYLTQGQLVHQRALPK